MFRNCAEVKNSTETLCEAPVFNDSDSEIEYYYHSTVNAILKSSNVKDGLKDDKLEGENVYLSSSPIANTKNMAFLPGLMELSFPTIRSLGSDSIENPNPLVINSNMTGAHSSYVVNTASVPQKPQNEELSDDGFNDAAIENLITPLNDSGIMTERHLDIIETDDEIDIDISRSVDFRIGGSVSHENIVINESKQKYKKPSRLCLFCKVPQTRLKRHILSKHSTEASVTPLLSMNVKDQNWKIELFRKEAIRNHNMSLVKSGKTCFIRERKSTTQDNELPLMCSGCKGFYSRKYKARHQLVCQASNLMLPMVSISLSEHIEKYPSDFINLLSTLQLDDIGNYIKSDEIILMIGARSFSALKRKKDKVSETRRLVRARMRLTARLYISFRSIFNKQTEVKLTDILNNAGDMYCREVITLVGEAINSISEKPNEDSDHFSEKSQKNGLKISILNLLKLTAKFLIGYFLVKNEDLRSQRVVDFLKVLKLYEDDLFGDAYYNLNYRKNTNLRKPINLPNEGDVQLLIEECNKIMNSIDDYEHPLNSFTTIRSATATCLTIFSARRGGEPVRLQLYQWNEALKGEWVDKQDLPVEFNSEQMFITYQTGKGGDHLVPVLFPPECIKAMHYLTNKEVRRNAGIPDKNQYIFASTQNSLSHASGWHCINEILIRLDKKGAINATQNRHRIATILAKLELSEKEKTLIFNHFGHSERINQNVYQAAPGSLQIKTTGQMLMNIHEAGKVDHIKSSSPSSSTLGEIKNKCIVEELLIPVKAVVTERKVYPKRTLKGKCKTNSESFHKHSNQYEESMDDVNDKSYKPEKIENNQISENSDEPGELGSQKQSCQLAKDDSPKNH